MSPFKTNPRVKQAVVVVRNGMIQEVITDSKESFEVIVKFCDIGSDNVPPVSFSNVPVNTSPGGVEKAFRDMRAQASGRPIGYHIASRLPVRESG